MIKLADAHKDILRRYNRPIVHLRQQVKANRFGLLFGAGLSKSFGIPTWDDLVALLADDPGIQGQEVHRMVSSRTGIPYKTEMLFEHFKSRRYEQADPEEHHTRRLDYEIGSDWREIIRKHLYAKVADKIEDTLAQHEYLKTYLPLIQASQMTVTYNFDDFIEQVLLHLDKEEERDTREFETVTNPWSQFRKSTGIIYHPNGIIPQNSLETPSDRFVFSEASYAEQLMGIYSGDQAWMVNHLSKHTCLFIGLSLNDDILRSVLMQSAKSSPGNFHYYVHHLKEHQGLSTDQMHAIRLANFNVYNLITLFLQSEEIRILGEMLDPNKCPTDSLCDFATSHDINMHFSIYVTGALGVGKSTTINQFRNLTVYDEWMEERPPLLAKDYEELTDAEKKEVDKFVLGQFKIKNDKLRNAREGIYVLDRGPLDPLAFTSAEAWKNKASDILKRLCPGGKWGVEEGRVLFLQGDPEELALRMVISQRQHYTPEKLTKMENLIGTAYGVDGVNRIDTRGLTPTEVVRQVAEIVHLDAYEPVCNLHDRLESIQEGKTLSPD